MYRHVRMPINTARCKLKRNEIAFYAEFHHLVKQLLCITSTVICLVWHVWTQHATQYCKIEISLRLWLRLWFIWIKLFFFPAVQICTYEIRQENKTHQSKRDTFTTKQQQLARAENRWKAIRPLTVCNVRIVCKNFYKSTSKLHFYECDIDWTNSNMSYKHHSWI